MRVKNFDDAGDYGWTFQKGDYTVRLFVFYVPVCIEYPLDIAAFRHDVQFNAAIKTALKKIHIMVHQHLHIILCIVQLIGQSDYLPLRSSCSKAVNKANYLHMFGYLKFLLFFTMFPIIIPNRKLIITPPISVYPIDITDCKNQIVRPVYAAYFIAVSSVDM